MPVRSEPVSVLVVNEAAEILTFLARALNAAGMRALLARNAQEAIGIGERGYVPIDLVLTGHALADGSSSGADLVKRLRELRPDLRALYMSSRIDGGVIRIELPERGCTGTSGCRDHGGLIETIWSAATAPLVRRMGGLPIQ